MQSIFDAITEWIKELLIGAIEGNLSNMFGDVNDKVGTIAAEVGATPQSWNSNIFSMIQSLSETVIIPIAGIIITYVPIPKDLTKVQTKVALGLTKRQLVCFGAAAAGLPLFFVLRGAMPSSAAAMIMILVMLPFFMLAMYQRHGQPLEVVIKNIVETKFMRPKVRPYQTNNLYAATARQANLYKEVKAIATGKKATRKGGAKTNRRR